MTIESAKVTEDTAEDIIGLPFEDDGERFIITGTSRNKDGELVVDYKDEKGKNLFSTVKEVRQWIQQTKLTPSNLTDEHIRGGIVKSFGCKSLTHLCNL